jgi:methionyl-tRNA formyltransferase
MDKKTICIAGKNAIACNAIDYILSRPSIIDNHVVIVVPNSDDSGEDGWQPSLLKKAIDHNLGIYNIEEVKQISELIFISLEYNRIIRPLEFLTDQLFNIHFSLLPEYRGVYTSIMPILHGKSYSGVSLHKIDAGIDTGDIIDQIRFDIPISYTSFDLYSRYNLEATKLFTRNLDYLLNNSYSLIKQSNEKSSYFSRKSINLNHLEVDTNKPGLEIYNYIRALLFPYYQYPRYLGKSICSVELLADNHQKAYTIEKKYAVIEGVDEVKVLVRYL